MKEVYRKKVTEHSNQHFFFKTAAKGTTTPRLNQSQEAAQLPS